MKGVKVQLMICFIGFGGSMIFAPCYIIVGQYFDKKKGRAMSMSTLGAGVGTLAFAPLLSLLLQQYMFSGAMLVLSGEIINRRVFTYNAEMWRS